MKGNIENVEIKCKHIYLMSSLVVTILSFQVIKLRLDAVKGQRGKNIKINNCNPYQGLVV